jgi:hypothetical protein
MQSRIQGSAFRHPASAPTSTFSVHGLPGKLASS